MIIVYASNSGFTEQYAKILMRELDVPAYKVDEIPEVHHGHDAVYLGWIMAGSIYGYKKAAKLVNVVCAAGTGMNPETPEMPEKLRAKMQIPAEVPVFYMQGGYDEKKLHGPYKLAMKAITAGIRKKMESEHTPEELKDDPTYKMVTGGYSVVSKERLAPVLAYLKEIGE